MTIKWPFKRMWAHRVAQDIAHDIAERTRRDEELAAAQARQASYTDILRRLRALAAEQGVRDEKESRT